MVFFPYLSSTLGVEKCSDFRNQHFFDEKVNLVGVFERSKLKITLEVRKYQENKKKWKGGNQFYFVDPTQKWMTVDTWNFHQIFVLLFAIQGNILKIFYSICKYN